MSVNPEDLLRPAGELDVVWFTESPVQLLEEAIHEAETAGADDPAVTAYAYHKAYIAIYLDMSRRPSTLDAAGARTGYLVTQMATFKERAEYWLTEYERLGSTAPVRSDRGRTTFVKARFTW